MHSLVSTDWLAEQLGAPDLSIVDCSWHMPASGRSGRAEYLQQHIPGARFLDIEEVRDTAHSAPHMLPSATKFANAAERLGIGSDDRIVLYDHSSTRTAMRGWFMFRHFGASRLAVLDGGLGKWLAEGRSTESGEPPERQARFNPRPRNGEVVTKAALLAGVAETLVDARGKPRFEGSETDPRPNVGAGHIPGARNLPYSALYTDDGTFRPREELRQLFRDAGIDPSGPFVASCGSGVTATSLIFAAHLLGNDQARLYDGSWSEWGADPATPKAIGPA